MYAKLKVAVKKLKLKKGTPKQAGSKSHKKIYDKKREIKLLENVTTSLFMITFKHFAQWNQIVFFFIFHRFCL